MEEISFLDRIGKIFGLITSSGFFISLLIIVILTVAFVVLNSKLKIKLPRIFLAIGYLIVIIFVIIKYGMAFYNIQDSFTNKVFSSFYFPNLITYVSILLISIFVIIIDFVNKEKTMAFKVVSIVSFGTIFTFFVIILDLVKKNEIDVTSAQSIYENTDLMVAIQASTAIFFIWMVIELIDYFSKKLALRLDNNEKNVNNASVNKQNYANRTINDYNNYTKQNYMNNYYNSKGYNNYGNYNNYNGYNNYNNYNNYSSNNYSSYDYSNYYGIGSSNNLDNNTDFYNNYYDMYNNTYKNDINKNVNKEKVIGKPKQDEYKSVHYLDEESNNTYKKVNYLNDSLDNYK